MFETNIMHTRLKAQQSFRISNKLKFFSLQNNILFFFLQFYVQEEKKKKNNKIKNKNIL